MAKVVLDLDWEGGGNLGSLRKWEREKPRNKEHFEVKTLEAGIVQGRKLL